MRKNKIDPSSHFVFLDIWCCSNFYSSFFSIVEKLNIPAIYKSIILIFSVNLPSSTSFIWNKLKSNNQENLKNNI